MTSMKTPTRNEYIALGAALLSLLIFAPAFLSIQSDASGGDSNLSAAVYQQFFPRAPQFSVASTQRAAPRVDVVDIEAGDGPTARPGDRLHLHYVGEVVGGTTAITSTGSEEPFSFVLGNGTTILGWELGLEGMREGGTRRLTIPSELAYGDEDVLDNDGDVLIPANSTLLFDIVLLQVEKP